jgi:hypothetical protein
MRVVYLVYIRHLFMVEAAVLSRGQVLRSIDISSSGQYIANSISINIRFFSTS